MRVNSRVIRTTTPGIAGSVVVFLTWSGIHPVPGSRAGRRWASCAAGPEVNLEGDGARFRYIEFEAREFQFLNGVRNFDVLIPLDLLAVLVEANRYGVPQFGCQLSAFHDLYLQMFDMCLAAE